LKLRALVLEEMAPCYENIYDAYSAVAIGYGTSDRLKDGVFHIAVYSKHVNLVSMTARRLMIRKVFSRARAIEFDTSRSKHLKTSSGRRSVLTFAAREKKRLRMRVSWANPS